MKLAWSLKYGVWYSIYSVVVKYSKVTVMVGQNRYSKLRIPSQFQTFVTGRRWPISLICILCKVMEHIVASNLARHLNGNDILYGLQHGFREKRSCETELIEPVEELGRKLSHGHQVDLVLLDFSKAFDKVNHLNSFLNFLLTALKEKLSNRLALS